MQKWIAWNRTVYLYKTGFGIKLLTKVDMQKKRKRKNPINNPDAFENNHRRKDSVYKENFC